MLHTMTSSPIRLMFLFCPPDYGNFNLTVHSILNGFGIFHSFKLIMKYQYLYGNEKMTFHFRIGRLNSFRIEQLPLERYTHLV